MNNWHITSTYFATVVKVAITQLVMTPPFLAFTLAYIQYFLTLDAKETVVAVKRSFAAAIFLNWKVSNEDNYHFRLIVCTRTVSLEIFFFTTGVDCCTSH